jgi:hypothetical protein
VSSKQRLREPAAMTIEVAAIASKTPHNPAYRAGRSVRNKNRAPRPIEIDLIPLAFFFPRWFDSRQRRQ